MPSHTATGVENSLLFQAGQIDALKIVPEVCLARIVPIGEVSPLVTEAFLSTSGGFAGGRTNEAWDATNYWYRSETVETSQFALVVNLEFEI
jgi:hypothetical protein